MRTTLDIADDVLQAAKELAAVRGEATGEVLSALARKGLEGPERQARTRNGVPLLPRRKPGARRPTMRMVNHLRDDAGPNREHEPRRAARRQRAADAVRSRPCAPRAGA